MAYLTITSGALKGRRFELVGGRARIGRVAGNDIVLDTPSVSGQNAEILCEAGFCRLRDLGSTNGTRLNEERVTEAGLYRGDGIQFGDLPAIFGGDEVPPRPAPPAGPAAAPEAAEELDAYAARPPVTVSSAADGQRAPSVCPPDFKRRRDTRVLWVVVIVVLVAMIAVAFAKFYHVIFR